MTGGGYGFEIGSTCPMYFGWTKKAGFVVCRIMFPVLSILGWSAHFLLIFWPFYMLASALLWEVHWGLLFPRLYSDKNFIKIQIRVFGRSTDIAKRSASTTPKMIFEGINPSTFMFAYMKTIKYYFNCCFNVEGVCFFICIFNTWETWLKGI